MAIAIKFLGGVTIATLALNIALHLAACIPHIRLSFFYVVPLFFLTFPLWISALGLVMIEGARSMNWSWGLSPRALRESYIQRTVLNARVLSSLPSWAKGMLIAVLAYCVLNFVICLHLSENGSAQFRDGKYVVVDHGRIVRRITEADYYRFQTNVVRLFSGHLILFHTIAALGILVVYPKLKHDNESKITV